MNSLLTISDVSKHYAKHTALKNINLRINEGQIFGLLGPNGAGKTSLIRIINQITAPDSGRIYFKDEPLAFKHIPKIGYLPEERGLYKKMYIGEQILYLAQLKGLSRAEALQRATYWFKKFEIESWWKKKVGELSKGMQQKVQFIVTVIHQPELLILDEPFTGFDPINANLLKEEILTLRKAGTTIIFSTHRMDSVEELCDDIALINQAEKILDGNKHQLKQDYKQNTYILDFVGNIPTELPLKYEQLEHEDKAINRIRLSLNQQHGEQFISSNDILKLLLPYVSILAFQEELPSINDIFIRMVNKSNETTSNTFYD